MYGPTHYRDKKTFWNNLEALKEDLEGKEIVIAMDFNATKMQSEKRWGSRVRYPYGENMEDLIYELDLLDLPLKMGNTLRVTEGRVQDTSQPGLIVSW